MSLSHKSNILLHVEVSVLNYHYILRPLFPALTTYGQGNLLSITGRWVFTLLAILKPVLWPFKDLSYLIGTRNSVPKIVSLERKSNHVSPFSAQT
jgi:hypothetical protein